MSEKLKKLTGKNPKDFEPVAYDIVNNSNVELFSELVAQEDFLFDFVKQNVANRLEKVCNKSNFLNLLNFLKYYSPSYENFIISTLAKYADEDLTDRMLEIFETGTTDEKTYCAKYFSIVQDTLAIDLLKKYSYDENSYLSSNCAATLAVLGDISSYEHALDKLNSEDEFTKLDAVRFLVSYGKKEALEPIINVMKKSSMADNIAGEVLYLADLFEIFKKNEENALFVLNSVISGLGEILGLAQIFDFRLYEFFEMLLKSDLTSAKAVVILSAQDKFETLTENNEYLFDETKDTKQEILEIKKLLNSFDSGVLYGLMDNELKQDSLFVFSAMEFTENEDSVRNLLTSANPTIVLKALETLKMLECMTPEDKKIALNSVQDENVRMVINAI